MNRLGFDSLENFLGRMSILWRGEDRDVRFEPRRLHLRAENSNHVVEEFALRFGRDKPISDHRRAIFSFRSHL